MKTAHEAWEAFWTGYVPKRDVSEHHKELMRELFAAGWEAAMKANAASGKAAKK